MQSHLYRLRVSIYEPANIIPHSRLLPEFSRNRFDNGDNRFLSRVKKPPLSRKVRVFVASSSSSKHATLTPASGQLE